MAPISPAAETAATQNGKMAGLVNGSTSPSPPHEPLTTPPKLPHLDDPGPPRPNKSSNYCNNGRGKDYSSKENNQRHGVDTANGAAQHPKALDKAGKADGTEKMEIADLSPLSTLPQKPVAAASTKPLVR